MSTLHFPNDKTFFTIKKIRDNSQIQEYVAPLNSFDGYGYLFYPATHFRTTNFKQNIDLVTIDTNYKIISLHEDVIPETYISFQNLLLSCLIFQKGTIARYALKKGDKLGLSSHR